MSKRRYKVGLQKRYDQVYEARKEKSPLLNPKYYRVNWTLLETATLKGQQGLLTEYSGRLERAAALLGTIDQEYERRQVAALRMGRAEITVMPDDLLAEQIDCQARHDVIAGEVALIEKLISEHKGRAEAAKDDKLLIHGPIGSGHGDPLRELDGQAIRVDRKGILLIDCVKSPYHGMKVCDYREKVCKPFVQWQRRPLTKEERDLGPHCPPRCGTIRWEDLPERPEGF